MSFYKTQNTFNLQKLDFSPPLCHLVKLSWPPPPYVECHVLFEVTLMWLGQAKYYNVPAQNKVWTESDNAVLLYMYIFKINFKKTKISLVMFNTALQIRQKSDLISDKVSTHSTRQVSNRCQGCGHISWVLKFTSKK